MKIIKKEIYIFVDNVRSLYNIGSIFRIADAIGAKKIYLAGYSGVECINGTYQLHRKISKTALEGIHIEWEHVADPIQKIIDLKSKGVSIISLEIANGSIDYRSYTYAFPLCIIIGHERTGVGEQLINYSDAIVHIPMHGKGKSLNVAIALGIFLYGL